MGMFKIGDVVHIVEHPVKIASTWVRDMDLYCGLEAEIVSASHFPDESTGRYQLKGIPFQWNDEAFQEFYESYTIEEDDMFSLLKID